ncbi:YicC family protein [Desulfovibrio sp. OttesenSCG-928-C14]|nr:YicC family protein [Desulfovibrio sp. OttesenSCG-928-C14]
MLRSMTGFGRYYLEDGELFSQTWEVRSVNGRFLDIKWRLPQSVRSLEPALEKTVRAHAGRGRVEISLNLQFSPGSAGLAAFNQGQASAMLDSLEKLARERGDEFTPDYNRMLGLSYLWNDEGLDFEGEFGQALSRGLTLALEDWNEARASEGEALRADLQKRILRLKNWVEDIVERAPQIKAERFENLRGRLQEAMDGLNDNPGQPSALILDENRFLQEMTFLADKLDVSEELTRLHAHLDRLDELLQKGEDAGRRLDFTLQECFREINTCGNKIQDAQLSRVIVDFKNELEKCREQVQNIE